MTDVHSSHHMIHLRHHLFVQISQSAYVRADGSFRNQILAFLKIVFLDTYRRYMSIQTYISHKIRSLARFAHMPGLGLRYHGSWIMDHGTSLRSPNPDLDSRQHPSPTNRPAWCFIIIHLELISHGAFTCSWRFPHGISSCRYLSTTSVAGRLLEEFHLTKAKWTIHGAVLFMSIFKREEMDSSNHDIYLWGCDSGFDVLLKLDPSG